MEGWIEILESMRKHKLRTFLTGFSVAWGIFILILLVSFGSGLKDFAMGMFSNDMDNTLFVYPGTTSLPYQGSRPGKTLSFTNSDLAHVLREVPDIQYHSARLILDGTQVSYGREKGAFTVRCVHPVHWKIEASTVIRGRYLNRYDNDKKRKNAVIGKTVKESLFGDEEAVGKYLKVNGIAFQVVGVFEDDTEEDEERMVYIPVAAAQQAFSKGEDITMMVLTIENPTIEKSRHTEKELARVLGASFNFDPEDDRALNIRNKMEATERVFNLLDSIRKFVFIISVLCIVSGSIGVMNIMVIAVKERTQEIGIRRAIGAPPGSIVFSVIKESVFITVFFGYMGLLCGAVILALINSLAGGGSAFSNLLVDLPLALFATGILVFVGLLSGLFPAIKASRIRPVEALNSQ